MSDPTLEHLIEIASVASDVVNEVYAREFSVEYKGPRDPVTEADRRANQLICTMLKQRFPGVPIVAEESDEASFVGFRSHRRTFFVDPVDGTREFVARNGEFVIMIGLVDGERATHGVIHAPAQDRCWAGSIEHGGFVIDRTGTRSPLQVGSESDLRRARVVASRSHRGPALVRALDALDASEVITLGSAGLKGVAIAEGAADIYVAPRYAGKRWDACACDAIVHAAGGTFTDARGRPIDYRGASLTNDQGVVATNGRLHDVVLERLRQLGAGGT